MEDLLFKDLKNKLNSYKKKYYINELLKGVIFSAGLIFTFYILLNTIEYYGRLNSSFRLLFLLSFLVTTIGAFWLWLLVPILQLFDIKNQLSDEEAAAQIGKFFPEIGDKLLNTIQLNYSNDATINALTKASIYQKSSLLNVFSFSSAIKYEENKKFSPLLILPVLLLLFIFLFIPNFFIDSTKRIIHYNKHFAPPAPFSFNLKNKELKAYRNEDYKIILSIEGSSLPNQVYVVEDNKRSKIYKDSSGMYVHILRNVQNPVNFYFEAAGFNSNNYNLSLLNKPQLNNFIAKLIYPKYLNKENEELSNIGNLVVPEGTIVNWQLLTEYTKSAKFLYGADSSIYNVNHKKIEFSKKLDVSGPYVIKLSNSEIKTEEILNYSIEIIKDQKPSISVNDFRDTATFNFLSIAGITSDDYGLTKLNLFYKIEKEESNNNNFNIIKLPINKNINSQNFNFTFNLDTLGIRPGERLEYFVKVWDNDGVNGPKSSQTSSNIFKIPKESEVDEQIESIADKNEKRINDLIKESKSLQNDFNKISDKLKNKNTLSWEDKKSIEETIKKHNSIEEDIKKLQSDNKVLNKNLEKFKEMDPALSMKFEQLQKLMDQLLNDETKKLLEELQKLLNEKADKNEVQKLVESIKKDDKNLNNELERSLEMFKELQFEKDLEQSIKDLEKLADEQNEVGNKTEKAKNKELEDLAKEQEKANNDFKNTQEKLQKLAEQNDQLKEKKDLSSLSESEKEVEKNQEKSLESLKSEEQKKAAEAQKSASKNMKKMAQDLAKMQNQMQMEQSQQDLGDLRSILENLITLSFEQESLMKDFKKVNQSDPRFITLSQKQFKLKDDSKIIEDSLLSLAKRVFQIESFVTREVAEMKSKMDESSSALKERRIDIASGKQQFAMTSINNLALLLNDVLKQMQDQMANASSSGGSCKKPNKKGNSSSMGDLQKQLNSGIEKLKQSGKSGKELSEELAKLTVQQEMIRKAIQELQKKEGNKGSGGDFEKLKKQMEETENDLVNKKLSQQTILRQQEILTRLLEVEKAAKERELDEKRESNTGNELPQIQSIALEKYLKDKQRELDLLKTVSPDLTPFFKQEVNDYFLKIEK